MLLELYKRLNKLQLGFNMNLEKKKPKYINEDGYEVYQSEDGKDYTIVTYDEFELHSKGSEARSGEEWRQ